MATGSAQAQAAQLGLAAALTRDLAQAWSVLDPEHLAETFDQFLLAVAALVNRYGLGSAGLAARYYQQERAAAGLRGRFTVRPADPPPLEQVRASLGWATRELRSPEPNAAAVRTLVDGVAQKLVADTGRNTVLAAVEADRQARGWARVARPGACHFCAMLSTRGAVYKSDQTGRFRAHDHCHCGVEPLFAAHYEPPAHVRQWQALWAATTAGKSGRDARIAFRRALEGGGT